jgi:hypothetical protein
MLLPATNIVFSPVDGIVSAEHLVEGCDRAFFLLPLASDRTPIARHNWQLPHVMSLHPGYFGTLTRTAHKPGAACAAHNKPELRQPMAYDSWGRLITVDLTLVISSKLLRMP